MGRRVDKRTDREVTTVLSSLFMVGEVKESLFSPEEKYREVKLAQSERDIELKSVWTKDHDDLVCLTLLL